ncbi:MAG: metallophosphoesterase [Synergistaceae bacterium]|jgi:predicted MPP superfamily phosphohydrolase|nr:metallophosphoesterase [Synergistaceae bacterium]
MPGNIFFRVVLGVYVSMNSYMFVRLFFTLAGSGLLRGIASAVFLIFALSFPASRLLSGILPSPVSDFLSVMGYLYLGPMIYGFLLTLAADFLRILNYQMTITPNPPPYTLSGREGVITLIVALSLVISLAGAVNTMFPAPVDIDVEWDGPSYRGSVSIALVSDIHLGKLVGPGHLRRIAELINSRSPDIVLIAGDSIDSSEWLRMQGRRSAAASILASLEPRLGVWAIPGNHDYYAGIEESVHFLEDCGVRVLRDEWAAPGGELILIGRDDLSVTMYGRSDGRRSLREITAEAARTWGVRNLPVVVLDHQPFNLDEAAESGADLQLSGHTHRGQIFPVNFIVAAIYEKHYGQYAKDGTRYYITSGAGTWGPPMRTIGRPEVVFINLHPRRQTQ